MSYVPKVKLTNTAASYAMSADDSIVSVTNVGTARTITLPSPSTVGIATLVLIKDSSGSCATTTITINPNASELINGDTSYILNTNYGAVGFYTDGTNWFTA